MSLSTDCLRAQVYNDAMAAIWAWVPLLAGLWLWEWESPALFPAHSKVRAASRWLAASQGPSPQPVFSPLPHLSFTFQNPLPLPVIVLCTSDKIGFVPMKRNFSFLHVNVFQRRANDQSSALMPDKLYWVLRDPREEREVSGGPWFFFYHLRNISQTITKLLMLNSKLQSQELHLINYS